MVKGPFKQIDYLTPPYGYQKNKVMKASLTIIAIAALLCSACGNWPTEKADSNPGATMRASPQEYHTPGAENPADSSGNVDSLMEVVP